MVEAIAFYLFSAVLVWCAFMAVTTQYVVRAAIYLLGALASVGALYIVLQAEFLAAVQFLVYVGGVVVVTIFAIFLVARVGDPTLAPSRRYRIAGLGLIAALVALLAGVQLAAVVDTGDQFGGGVVVDAHSIGRVLLSAEGDGFLFPFELISVLLLAALVGAVVVARTRVRTKSSSGEATQESSN